ncbi:transcriptional regulator, partial [Salmonella enterica subsp. enterica serovar Typhimurium]
NDPMTLERWLPAGTGIANDPQMREIDENNRGEQEILLPRNQTDPRPVNALYTERDKLTLKEQEVINEITD